MKCKNCGNIIEKNEEYCSNCGNKIEKSNVKKNILLIVLGILILILLLFFKSWIDYKNASNKATGTKSSEDYNSNSSKDKKTKNNSNEELETNLCKTNNCYKLTMYYLSGDDNENLIEEHTTFLVDSNYSLNASTIINSINSVYKKEDWERYSNNDAVTYDSQNNSFYINIADQKFEFSWYYRNSDEKFNWNNPVDKDTEIEMKLFNGVLDNKFLLDVSKYIKQ